MLIFLEVAILAMGLFVNSIRRTGGRGIEKKELSNSSLFVFATASFLAFFSGFRGNFTTDYDNYVYLFHYIGEHSFVSVLLNSFNTDTEILYNILTKIVYDFSNSEVLHFVVFACITVFFFCAGFKNHSRIFWLSIFFFVASGLFFVSFNLVRQILAVAIVFWGTKYVYEGRKYKFIFSVLLACMFHKTAFIGLLLLFFSHVKSSKRIAILQLLAVFCSMIFLYFFTQDLIGFVSRFIYTSYNKSAYGMGKGLPFTSLSKSVLLGFYLFLLRKYINYQDIREKTWMYCFFFYLIFCIVALRIELMVRFTYFFLPYVFLLIPNLLVKMSTGKRNRYLVFMIISFLLYSTISSGAQIDYFFVWE